MSRDIDLSGYNDVASRMREFFDKHPDGRLRPASPWRVEVIGDKAFIVYEAAAYRTADDANPGIGTAWEPFPGRTPYTRDSELMNAETSAWGRAILAVGAADTKRGVASAEEVRNRSAERDQWEEATPAATAAQSKLFDDFLRDIQGAETAGAIGALGAGVKTAETESLITHFQYERLARTAASRLAELPTEGAA